MNTRINVLIPDGDSTWALSVLHCLSQSERYNIFVLSNKKRTATKFSKFKSYYKFYERHNDEQWLDIVNSEIQKQEISVVIPIAEHEMSFFIRYKEQISAISKIIPLPSINDFEIAIDKKLLSDFARSNAIPHPKSVMFASESNKLEILSSFEYPILIKPLSLKGGDGIEKVDSYDQFPKLKEEPLLIQEYIEGYDIDCSVLCLNGVILAYTIQKGNLEGDTAYAPQLAFDFVDNEEVLQVTKKVMTKLNWSGVAHLDLRYDQKAKNYKLIEVNARFWGSVEASNVAGVNFPDLICRVALEQPLLYKGFKKINYMRLKGVLKTIRRNPLFICKRYYLMNNTETRLFLKDPMPTVYKFREWLGRKF
ncbi:ATP-grasp domain-containing protein [Psychroserpens sp. MEBiC05023]